MVQSPLQNVDLVETDLCKDAEEGPARERDRHRKYTFDGEAQVINILMKTTNIYLYRINSHVFICIVYINTFSCIIYSISFYFHAPGRN